MAGMTIIDIEKCKGCGLCVWVCPKGSLTICEQSNKKGYFPAKVIGTECSVCAMCGIIFPEAVIEVHRNDSEQ